MPLMYEKLQERDVFKKYVYFTVNIYVSNIVLHDKILIVIILITLFLDFTEWKISACPKYNSCQWTDAGPATQVIRTFF